MTDTSTTDADTNDTSTTDAETSHTSSTDAELETDTEESSHSAADSLVDPNRVRRSLHYLLLGGLALLAVVAAVQFYLHTSAAIGRWVAPAYRSLFQAAFNLAVLLVAVGGIQRELSRLRPDT